MSYIDLGLIDIGRMQTGVARISEVLFGVSVDLPTRRFLDDADRLRSALRACGSLTPSDDGSTGRNLRVQVHTARVKLALSRATKLKRSLRDMPFPANLKSQVSESLGFVRLTLGNARQEKLKLDTLFDKR